MNAQRPAAIQMASGLKLIRMPLGEAIRRRFVGRAPTDYFGDIPVFTDPACPPDTVCFIEEPRSLDAINQAMAVEMRETQAPLARAMGVAEAPEAPDPWKHRAAGMRCATCMWYLPKAAERIDWKTVTKPTIAEIGRCRRHAPTMNGYPVVYPADWCGDHKLDETKL